MTAAEQVAGETTTEYQHIVCRSDVLGGQPVVRGTRLPVWQLANLWNRGASMADLLDTYPGLTPAALHSAHAYYWDHQDLLDAVIDANRPEEIPA